VGEGGLEVWGSDGEGGMGMITWGKAMNSQALEISDSFFRDTFLLDIFE
jgi:hypothetical protein